MVFCRSLKTVLAKEMGAMPFVNEKEAMLILDAKSGRNVEGVVGGEWNIFVKFQV